MEANIKTTEVAVTEQTAYPWTFRKAFDVVQQIFKLSELSEAQFARGRVCLTSGNWKFIAIPGVWALSRNEVTLFSGCARVSKCRVSIGA